MTIDTNQQGHTEIVKFDIHENRLKEMDLPMIEKRDLKDFYKYTSGLDEFERSDLIMTEEGG